MTIIDGLLNDQALTALVAIVAITTLADLIVSTSFAIAAGTFKVEYLLDFLKSHVAGRIFPIVTLAILGHFEPALFAIAAPAAAAYVVETLASLKESVDGINFPQGRRW